MTDTIIEKVILLAMGLFALYAATNMLFRSRRIFWEALKELGSWKSFDKE